MMRRSARTHTAAQKQTDLEFYTIRWMCALGGGLCESFGRLWAISPRTQSDRCAYTLSMDVHSFGWH